MDDNPWGAPSPSPDPTPLATPPPPPPLDLAPSVAPSEPESNDWDASPATAFVNAVEEEVKEEEPVPEVEKEVTVVELVEELEVAPEVEEEEVDEVAAEEGVVEEVLASPVAPPSLLPLTLPEHEGPPMDDFDDEPSLDAPPPPADFDDAFGDSFDDDFGELGGDDDFGDFGDFGGDAEGDASAFGAAPEPFVEEPLQPVASTSASAYPPLRLDLSDPTRDVVASQLAPFFESAYPFARSAISDEPERQVDGVGQVLVNDSLRELLSTLSSLPPLRPLDWRRSRIRREHLIALGVPVNLDDSAESKPLASLVLPSQLPPRSASPVSFASSSAPATSSPLPFSSSSRSRPSTPRGTDRVSSIPVPPPLDRKRAEEVCAIGEDDLILMSLDKLKALRTELEKHSMEASQLLTHSLQLREKEVGDGETYNGMIQDLVTAAAKMKTTSSRSGAGSSRPSSGMGWTRKTSGSTSSVR